MKTAQGPFWIEPGDPDLGFPDTRLALSEPNGLLAIGGDLSPERLLSAYRQGIFPWYSDGQPILWWSPQPRMVLYPDELHISRSLAKRLRNGGFQVSINNAFERVIQHCSEPRADAGGTWITAQMKQAYIRLHQLGFAHSAEAWYENQLVGGLYGVGIGQVFFGESMFSQRTDSSKIAFAHLVRQVKYHGVQLIDCQVRTAHLASLGAREIPREEFVSQLNTLCGAPIDAAAWKADTPAGPEGWN